MNKIPNLIILKFNLLMKYLLTILNSILKTLRKIVILYVDCNIGLLGDI